MLVKILTDYGQVPTVVVWDAGMSGRKEISRRLQGAAHPPGPTCSSSSGRTCGRWSRPSATGTSRVEGFEADDVIAALTEQAKERGVPVMVVTGDRDAYQLVDDGVRIMSTSRGVTDTKVYDRDARDRALRHPARARPRLHRPQGRHLATTSPASPASATRPPPTCCRSSATSRACCPASTRSPAPSASRT